MSRAQSQVFRGTPSLEAEEKKRLIDQIISNEFGEIKNTQRLQRQFALDKLPFEEIKKISEGKSSHPMAKSAPADPFRDRAATTMPGKRPLPRPNSPSPTTITTPFPLQAREAFPVQLKLTTGETMIVTGYSDISTSDFINEAFQKIKEFLDPNTTIDSLVLVDAEGSRISSQLLAENPYISKCRKQTEIAIISVVPISEDLSPRDLRPVTPTKPLPQISSSDSKSLMDEPTGDLPQPAQRMNSSGVIVRQQQSIISQAQHFKNVLNDKLTQSMARGYTKKQIREFQVQFLLPGGSTEVMSCNVDMTVAQVKEELHKRTAKASKLRPMEHYLLKTPSADGYLSEESTKISEISFIEQCRAQSTTPKLILVEKSTAFTKKEKLINLEIGSLIGSPLCWTQDDSEITQLRKTMTWVRYQEKKESKEPSPQQADDSSSTTISPGVKLYVKLRLPLVESTLEKTVIITENQTANDFIKQMFTKYYEKPLLSKGITKQPSDFVLKATGFAEYISGDKLLTSFEYIKKTFQKSTQVPLSLVEAQATTENDIYVEDFPDDQFLQDPVYKYDHEEIKSDLAPWDRLTSISIWEMTRNFKVKVVGVENIKQKLENEHQIFISAGLYHGGELVSPLTTSQITSFSNNPRWYEWLSFNIQMCNIPRATRICFTLFSRSSSKEDIPLGWVACQLFDYKHELRTGLMSLNLWPDDKANPIGTCVGYNYPNAATLFIEFETYTLPVVFPTEPNKNIPPEYCELGTGRKSAIITANAKATKLMGVGVSQIDKLIATDPLYTLTDADKKSLWAERDYLKTKPKSLPKLLLSVPYNDRHSVQVMHELLATWPPIAAVDGLELLDSKNADNKVREFAVRCLEQLSDDELLDFLLQLVQVLKYEPYHDSELARFLLRRGLKNRRVGHSLFWYLRSEMHVQEISERYGLLLEAYLRGCGSHRTELGRQTALLKELVRIATMLKTVKDPEQRKAVLKEELPKVQFPTKVQLPLNPSIEVQGFRLEKCKFMDSKKVPLWLVFNNADSNGPPKYVIFKEGDDLRQDMLTLQMIRLMDKLWKNEGLDLQMSPYGCISTGDEEGMIEVVLNSDTVANITKNAGGATAAFKEDTIANWLRSLTSSEEDYSKSVENFIYSCAGYCVATYVLGIGDRHNDNLMITKDGKLFHIDFGHFLGNYKKKFGFKRERAPFVFTPDFAYVMGRRDSKDFMRFCDVSCKAYNILRRYANVFINLFAMMLSTGIPELQSEEDISYLREAFSLDMNDTQAREKFKNLIYESLTTKTTQFNNAIHILAH